MLQLRLTQHDDGPGKHRIEIAVEGGGSRRTAEARFDFVLARQDEEDLRWYLEEYLLHPNEPARVVERIEKRIAEIGEELFRKVFDGDAVARKRWFEVAERLSELRVEIVTSAEAAATLPWELLRDPLTRAPFALSVRAFVRALPEAARSPRLPVGEAGPVRILLAICRPHGARDVGFRSVASQLIKGLTEANRRAYDLVVLRPPTFEQLGQTLREAQSQGRPFHVVHFDGHGGYLDLAVIAKSVAEKPEAEAERLLRDLLDLPHDRFAPQTFRLTLRDLYPRPTRPGRHSYLVFEDSGRQVNQRLVDGPELGKLLVEAGVSTLVLNACRSAYAQRSKDADNGEALAEEARNGEAGAVQARTWSTLAQEVMDAGVPAVVAMRYNLWVVTAAQFVADLYAALAKGEAVGEAVTVGRKQLDGNPLRTIAYDPLGASLAYGFEHAFGEEERKVLALLYLFQGFVDVDALCLMGSPDKHWCLAEVRGLTREAGMALLDRAAEVGHLTKVSDGYYTIHPALPWFFHNLFEATFADGGERAVKAYVEAEADLGNHHWKRYNEGRREVISPLRFEEPNLLHARRLARSFGLHNATLLTMEGLGTLFFHTGRLAEWKRLLEEIVPDFVDSETSGPLPGLGSA